MKGGQAVQLLSCIQNSRSLSEINENIYDELHTSKSLILSCKAWIEIQLNHFSSRIGIAICVVLKAQEFIAYRLIILLVIYDYIISVNADTRQTVPLKWFVMQETIIRLSVIYVIYVAVNFVMKLWCKSI